MSRFWSITWYMLIAAFIAGIGFVVSAGRIFVHSTSVVIDSQSPPPPIQIQAFRSYDGRIILDLNTELGHDVYLIEPSIRNISIANQSSIISVFGLMISKEAKLEGVSFDKAEITVLPVWTERSLRFVGLRGRSVDLHWLF